MSNDGDKRRAPRIGDIYRVEPNNHYFMVVRVHAADDIDIMWLHPSNRLFGTVINHDSLWSNDMLIAECES